MGYADAAAEKCGDVVEMWLGMLDLANMTKSQITFMEPRADPGDELLAGREKHRSTSSMGRQDLPQLQIPKEVDRESQSPRTMRRL